MRIEAEIKARLVAEKFANLTRLGVLSRGGVVYLSGSVASPDERRRAEALSASVQGVERVVNTLEVQNELGPHPPPGWPGPRRERGPRPPDEARRRSDTGTMALRVTWPSSGWRNASLISTSKAKR